MTAKQLLHQFVDGVTEDDAAVTVAMLIPTAGRALTATELAAIDAGLAEADAGEFIPIEDVEREFGIL